MYAPPHSGREAGTSLGWLCPPGKRGYLLFSLPPPWRPHSQPPVCPPPPHTQGFPYGGGWLMSQAVQGALGRSLVFLLMWGGILAFCFSAVSFSGFWCQCGLRAGQGWVIVTSLHFHSHFQFLQAALLLFNILLESKLGSQHKAIAFPLATESRGVVGTVPCPGSTG